MPKKAAPARKSALTHEQSTYLVLIALVAGLVAFGTLHYSLLLAVGSAGFVGFFGWLWWWRKNQAVAESTRGTRRIPSPRKRPKTSRRR